MIANRSKESSILSSLSTRGPGYSRNISCPAACASIANVEFSGDVADLMGATEEVKRPAAIHPREQSHTSSARTFQTPTLSIGVS